MNVKRVIQGLKYKWNKQKFKVAWFDYLYFNTKGQNAQGWFRASLENKQCYSLNLIRSQRQITSVNGLSCLLFQALVGFEILHLCLAFHSVLDCHLMATQPEREPKHLPKTFPQSVIRNRLQ